MWRKAGGQASDWPPVCASGRTAGCDLPYHVGEALPGRALLGGVHCDHVREDLWGWPCGTHDPGEEASVRGATSRPKRLGRHQLGSSNNVPWFTQNTEIIPYWLENSHSEPAGASLFPGPCPSL